MIIASESVQSATIVDRRSGPGYRLVIRKMTQSGTPVLETLEDSFQSVASAKSFAVDVLGIAAGKVRNNVRAHA